MNWCIDGFSRNFTWLEAKTTKSDPRVITSPYRVCCDLGTKNAHVKQMQKFLRRNHYDGIEKSTHNQGIEWSWGVLGKNQVCSGWMYFGKWQVTQELP